MNEDPKGRIRKSYERQIKNSRSREEEQRLREHSKQRRNQRQKRKPRHKDWNALNDEPAGTDSMASSKAAYARDRKQSIPEFDVLPSNDSLDPKAQRATALVLGVERTRMRVRLEPEVQPQIATGAIEALPAADDLVIDFSSAARNSTRVVTGDRVIISKRAADPWHFQALVERSSKLFRPDPANSQRELVLAANIDLGLIVLAAGRGGFAPSLLDRVLVALERSGIAALICVNKIDRLSTTAERSKVESDLDVYRRLGHGALALSAHAGQGMDELRRQLQGRHAALVGKSGVGKTSLLAAIHPASNRAVAPVRAADDRGRHTTTSSELVFLDANSWIVDTPGVRSFGLWNLDESSVRDAFPEFAELAGDCRFRDCLHVREPQCAVREAVQRGWLVRARYDSYRRILASLEP